MDDSSLILRRLTREQKRRAMVRYLSEQGTLFNSFLNSSEEKKRVKLSRGKLVLFCLLMNRRRMSVNSGDDENLLLDTNEVELLRIQSQPACIKGTMRLYQIEALNWLVNQYQLGLNSILADEMGR